MKSSECERRKYVVEMAAIRGFRVCHAESGSAPAAARNSRRLIIRLLYRLMTEQEHTEPRAEFYCPACAVAVPDPLVCGDCHALICRQCGTPVERIDELGIG
jgi:hypothetical protein